MVYSAFFKGKEVAVKEIRGETVTQAMITAFEKVCFVCVCVCACVSVLFLCVTCLCMMYACVC